MRNVLFPVSENNFGRAGFCVRGCGAKRSIYWRISPFCPCTQYFAYVPLMCGFRHLEKLFCASPLDPTHEEQSILLFRPTKRSFPPSFSRLIFLWEMYARTYIFLKASFRRETFSFFPGSFIPSLPAAEEGGKSKRRVKRYIGRKRENGVPATGGRKGKRRRFKVSTFFVVKQQGETLSPPTPPQSPRKKRRGT